MTTTQPNQAPADEHDELVKLIPWYVKGNLTSSENDAVQRHLELCEICREELSNCSALVEHFPASADDWKPSPAHFASLLAAVDELESASARPRAAPAAEIGWFRRLGAWLAQTPTPVRWTLAVESLALAALAVLVALPPQPIPDERAVFQTLSDTESPAKSQGMLVRLVFAEDMTTGELADLLKQAKAQICRGPSLTGSYTVEVPAAEADLSLVILRDHPKVRLAQPVPAVSPGS
ncbi:zf-HC2 domain-containing protein [Methylococcus sp. EFPC2]|uniref:zf-HC2 domain-containing protein n=1 Tax=Methylococcus sp. EFPC2 TaxID=2812648 RepID=UPI00196781C1|nr:zf-HC2 domain-containing protein [Methylococcus sp. EFPC2]QSA95636.1 zf-HC2 domain-containing protein [Methylococcus sp. EFPC2]